MRATSSKAAASYQVHAVHPVSQAASQSRKQHEPSIGLLCSHGVEAHALSNLLLQLGQKVRLHANFLSVAKAAYHVVEAWQLQVLDQVPLLRAHLGECHLQEELPVTMSIRA